jgi:hypothetical protein
MNPNRTLSTALPLVCAIATLAWSPSEDVQLAAAPRAGDMLLAQDPQIQVVTLGTHNGTLAAGDSQLSTGEYYDAWEFDGTNGQVLRISMYSSELDPYLMVRGPGGTSLDNDDRQSGDLNAEIVITLPMTGRYQISTTSYQPGETGPYRLQIEQIGGAGQGVAVAPGLSSGTPTPSPEAATISTDDQTARAREIVQWLQTSGLVNFAWTKEDRQDSRRGVDVSTYDYTLGLDLNNPCIWEINTTWAAHHALAGLPDESDSGVRSASISFAMGQVEASVNSPCNVRGGSTRSQVWTNCVTQVTLSDHLGGRVWIGTQLSANRLGDLDDAVTPLNEICGPTRPY